MRILTNFPYSPFGRSAGSTQRFNQIILGLREPGHEIRLWSFKNPSGYQWTDVDLERAKQLGIDVVLTEKGEFEPSALEGIDAVWGIYFHYMKFYDDFIGPKLVDMHDILTSNFQIDEYFGNFLSKEGEIFSFDRETFKEPFHTEFPIRDEELEVYRKVHPITISQRETDYIARKGIKTTYIPFLPSLPEVVSDQRALPLTLCSAHLNNLWANDMLGIEMLPRIRLKCPSFEINCMGELDTICRHFPAINYLGYTENNTALKSARFGIWASPFGSGSQLKLYTYASYGLPIVCFKQRAEPFIVHGENSLIATTVDEFVQYCLRLWNDIELCRKMGRAARESVENFYSKDRMLNDLNSVIHKYLNGH